jgi:hypothetical protein
MKFYSIVIILALATVLGVILIVRKNKSKDCDCSKKFTEDYTESEVLVEREG